MKDQTPNPAAAQKKVRRKSETLNLTLSSEASWLLGEFLRRFEEEQLAFYPAEQREIKRWDAAERGRVRRGYSHALLELALESVLELPSVLSGCGVWKLTADYLDEEERAAQHALISANISPREDEISDEKEAAGIALIKGGKEAMPWNGT